MKIFAPDYYKNFKCLMGECKHSCCIGWEIDIDDKTAEYYKNIEGEFGKRLRTDIDFGDECSSFSLCEDERCPFLNKDGLCDIILNLGEDSLCQVCDDHPRFRNFFDSRTEIGLGLCCEAVAKMILEKESKTVLGVIEDDGEKEEIPEEEANFFAVRDKIFDAVCDRSKNIGERISEVLSLCGAKPLRIDFSEWADIYLDLERLDENWTEILEGIKKNPKEPEIENETAAEQLLWYFVFRHLGEAVYDARLAERAAFAVMSFYMTEKAAEQVGIFEAARLYSSEIEYSDENIEILLDAISEERCF